MNEISHIGSLRWLRFTRPVFRAGWAVFFMASLVAFQFTQAEVGSETDQAEDSCCRTCHCETRTCCVSPAPGPVSSRAPLAPVSQTSHDQRSLAGENCHDTTPLYQSAFTANLSLDLYPLIPASALPLHVRFCTFLI